MKSITAKEIVKKFGLSYHTVNYYTAIGLLPVFLKKGNQRIYDDDDVSKRLKEIIQMSSQGYPLTLIRKKLTGY